MSKIAEVHSLITRDRIPLTGYCQRCKSIVECDTPLCDICKEIDRREERAARAREDHHQSKLSLPTGAQ